MNAEQTAAKLLEDDDFDPEDADRLVKPRLNLDNLRTVLARHDVFLEWWDYSRTDKTMVMCASFQRDKESAQHALNGALSEIGTWKCRPVVVEDGGSVEAGGLSGTGYRKWRFYVLFPRSMFDPARD